MADESELPGLQGTHRGAWTDRKWRICKVMKERPHAFRAQLRKEDFPQGGLGQASWQKLHLGWILRCRYIQGMEKGILEAGSYMSRQKGIYLKQNNV